MIILSPVYEHFEIHLNVTLKLTTKVLLLYTHISRLFAL